MNKYYYWVLVMGLSALMGCSSSVNKSTDILQMRLGGEPSVLNPILSTDVPSSEVGGLIFDGLFHVNSDLQLEANLITTYNVSEDHLVYTFSLKPDVKWHDGHPFTSEDVVFTFNKILDPSTNTVRRSNYIINQKPILFEATGPLEVTVSLPQPFSPFLLHMGMGILPKHLLEGVDINTATFNRQPVGLGPFKFHSWHSSQFVRLKRNEDYHRGEVRVAEIIQKIIPDQNTALVSLERGEIDRAGIPAKDVPRYRDQPELDIYEYYDLVYTYLGFNLKHPIFSNTQIRQAIAYALDRQIMIDSVLKGMGQEAHLPSSPLLWSYPEDDRIKKYAYNPEKSRAILAQEGFVLNAKTGMLEKEGVPFKFTIITNKGNKDREKICQLIQQFLKEVGIHVDIQLMEWSAFLKVVNAYKDPKEYDAVVLGWSLGLDPDLYAIWHSSQYPRGFNFIGYQNPQVDRLIEQGRQALQQSTRREIYAQAYQAITQDAGYVFLYIPQSIVGMNKRVKGLSKPGPAGLMNRIEEIYLVE
ncbi:MAG: peptide-binding protein [Actinobacteria bacterium]|nr:peptide-binding protein [Actinomycetota bacterium]